LRRFLSGQRPTSLGLSHRTRKYATAGNENPQTCEIGQWSKTAAGQDRFVHESSRGPRRRPRSRSVNLVSNARSNMRTIRFMVGEQVQTEQEPFHQSAGSRCFLIEKHSVWPVRKARR